MTPLRKSVAYAVSSNSGVWHCTRVPIHPKLASSGTRRRLSRRSCTDIRGARVEAELSAVVRAYSNETLTSAVPRLPKPSTAIDTS